MTAATTAGATLRRQGPLEVLAWPALDSLGADVLITTRHGGVSAGGYASLNLALHVGDDPDLVITNRERAAAAAGAELSDLVFCEQTHGRGVAVVSAADRGRGTLRRGDAILQADAVVTSDPGTVLAVMMADCVPIVLLDPQARVLGCVHAGWRGTVAGVTGAALHAMRSLGARPDRMVAAIGPAIDPRRYQVGPEVTGAAQRFFGDLSGLARPDGTGRWLFDLPAANRRVLREAGVPAGQILDAGVATGQPAGLFFSDREQRPCGRFAALARLRPEGTA